MRRNVLLHAAILLLVIASLMIILQRAIAHDPGGAILNSHDLPLGVVTLISAVLLETFRRRLTGFSIPLVIIFAVAFLICSFFLPSKGHSNEPAIAIAYVALLTLLSTAVVIAVSGKPGIGKISVVFFFISLAAFIGGFVNTFSDRENYHGNPEADAAVVLGGAVWGPHMPSPDLKARLDAAAELYKKGDARKIAVTGGTRRFNTYESAIGAWYLRSIGIPASAIITEDKTLNTLEQVIYVKRYLMDKLKMKNVVIVSDSWHLPRALLMCKWLNVKAEGYPSHYRMSFQSEVFWRLRESAGVQAYILFGA